MTTTPIYNLTDTWNDASASFTAVKMNVTDTQSADNSLLFDLQVGGTSLFRVDKSGYIPDSVFGIADDEDRTKRVRFQASGVTTGTTRTKTFQDVSGTIYETGGQDVSVADGGTGASTAAAAKVNLRVGLTEPLEAYGSGVGEGTASADQTAFAAAATAGAYVELKAGTTYYMNAGLTPATGFGLHFNPGAKIVLVTQASGSGSDGFKNYSGAAAARNSTAGTAFMLTADNGSFYFTGDVRFEGDNNNQPILRPIYAKDCYLYIPGRFTVRNLNACSGALSLDAMRGGNIGDGDVVANAYMDEFVLTLTGSVSVVAGETLTQATSGATGVVVAASTGNKVTLESTTGTFNTSNQLTGSTSGALGANSVPTAVEGADVGYTNLGSTYSPAGIVFDDDGSFRSARMTFGDWFVSGLDRDASGVGAGQSDGVMVGGIDKALRSGTVGGHIFNSIRVESMGEAFDCFQSFCYVGALIGRSLTGFGAKFIHGAQNNVIEWIDIDGYGNGGVIFAGSGTSTQHCDGNQVLGGRIAGASATNADSAPVRIDDNSAGTASVPKRNLVLNVDFYGESTSDYVVRSNLDATTAGAIAAGEENRIYGCRNLGDAPATAYALNANGGILYDAISEFGDRVLRATASQRGQVELATNAETTTGTDTERATTPAGVKAVADTKADAENPTITSGATFEDAATNLSFNVNQQVPYATSSGADDVISIQAYRMRDSNEDQVTFFQEIIRGVSRASGSHQGKKVYRTNQGATTRDHEIGYGGFYAATGGAYFVGGTQVVGAQQTTGVAEATFVENSGGTAVNVDSTFGGYTMQQVVQALQNHGLLA